MNHRAVQRQRSERECRGFARQCERAANKRRCVLRCDQIVCPWLQTAIEESTWDCRATPWRLWGGRWCQTCRWACSRGQDVAPRCASPTTSKQARACAQQQRQHTHATSDGSARHNATHLTSWCFGVKRDEFFPRIDWRGGVGVACAHLLWHVACVHHDCFQFWQLITNYTFTQSSQVIKQTQ